MAQPLGLPQGASLPKAVDLGSSCTLRYGGPHGIEKDCKLLLIHASSHDRFLPRVCRSPNRQHPPARSCQIPCRMFLTNVSLWNCLPSKITRVWDGVHTVVSIYSRKPSSIGSALGGELHRLDRT